MEQMLSRDRYAQYMQKSVGRSESCLLEASLSCPMIRSSSATDTTEAKLGAAVADNL